MANICDYVRKALEYQEDELNRELRSQGKRLVLIHVTDDDTHRKESQQAEEHKEQVESSCYEGESEDEVWSNWHKNK